METSRIFDVPLAPPEGGREARSDRIVPLSAAGSPPQSVTGIMGARHAESPPHPPSDMFGFGDAIPVNPAVPAPVVPPPAIQAPIIPPSVIPLPVIPRMPAAPVLAAPSIAAAAGAAVTLGVAAGSAPPPNAPAGVAPSEFTRVLQGVAAPAAAAAVVTGAAIAGQKKKDQQAGRTGPSIVPLVVGLNILLIAAIGLILYFVLAG
jgi:hypothetical protein